MSGRSSRISSCGGSNGTLQIAGGGLGKKFPL